MREAMSPLSSVFACYSVVGHNVLLVYTMMLRVRRVRMHACALVCASNAQKTDALASLTAFVCAPQTYCTSPKHSALVWSQNIQRTLVFLCSSVDDLNDT
jgi:hypothetical protein